MTLLKSIAHNIFVVLVGFFFAFLCSRLDALFGIARFASTGTDALGWALVAAGFGLRVWATWCFYEQHMKVISLVPQGALVTSGPFAFSRNPLYLGGNVFVFFGAMLVLGSTSGLVLTAAHLFAMDRMVRREERQLASTFGEEWTSYSRRVRRWL